MRVVLAYDVRQFEDKRGVYDPTLPNPVLHMTSRDFCQHAAGVYAANGVHTYILPPDADRVRVDARTVVHDPTSARPTAG